MHFLSEDDKAKLNEMNTRREKIGYVWDYYKLWIIGAAVLICLIVYFTVVIVNRDGDAALDIVFVNNYDNVSEDSDFAKGFVSYVGEENLDGSVVFDNSAFFNLAKASDFRNSYYMKVVAYLEAGTADAVVCQYDNLMGLAQGGRLADISDKRLKSIYDKYEDRIVWYEGDSGKTAVGIDISDGYAAAGLTEYDDGKAYIGISAYIDDYELVEQFIDYVLSK